METMLDALPLPPRPKLEQCKAHAKDLVKICKSGDRDALRAWVTEWIEALVAPPRDGRRPYSSGEIGYRTERAVQRIAKQLGASDPPQRAACTVAHAQLVLAREHGFGTWTKFAKHLEGLSQAGSPVRAFEAAVDAIVSGDRATLAKLLKKNPKIVRARSLREHRSTLLHYVSANGVEAYRQVTPKNIVEITKLLLKAGADVNAESDAYAGRSTTIGLAATSYHPQAAGVQLPLMEVLIEHGAMIDGPDGGSAVNGCLHNGRGEAAEFLAGRGARLDLEGAAGVGRLDVVRSFFKDDGSLKRPATKNQMIAGFAWACEFGRTAVVEFLLERGIDVNAKRGQGGGETGLHWASFLGHPGLVKLLLERGARVDIKDKRHDGTPLEWALHGWQDPPPLAERPGYYEVVAMLSRAGARLDPAWHKTVVNRQSALKKIQSDPRMAVALRGNF